MCACACACVHVRARVFMRVRVLMCVCVHARTYVCLCACPCVRVRVCVCLCACAMFINHREKDENKELPSQNKIWSKMIEQSESFSISCKCKIIQTQSFHCFCLHCLPLCDSAFPSLC